MKKKLFRSVLIFALLIVVSSFALAQEVSLTILHTNDTHSRLEEDAYAGMGFAKIATLVEQYRNENSNVMVLDAGDTFHGQTIANLVQGDSVVAILNSIGYTAMAPGNHDFNYGQERLVELDQLTDFPILAANIKTASGADLLTPYIIKDIDGVKVAIFGLATPETTYKTHPKNVEGLTFVNPINAAKEMVNHLEDQADVIIALTHLGLDENSQYTSKKIAQQVPGIDVIVDGHSHSVLEEGLKVGDTLIVMAGEYDKNLGVVNLTIDNGQVLTATAHLITKDSVADLASNSDILAVIDEIKAKNEEITSVVIGKTSVHLDGERADVRTSETNLGNLITDSILAAVDAEVAITNGGGIRASIPVGQITKGDVITVLPFGNTVVVKEITGSDILDAVEHGISGYPEPQGSYPQVAGMTVLFAPSRPAGERVIKLWINDEPVDYNKLYKVATNDFMAAGGDGYEMFASGDVFQEAGGLEEVTMAYIKDHGTVAPKVEGRMVPVRETIAGFHYTVQSGDTLSELADIFNLSVEELAKANTILNPALIYVGQELIIPLD